MSNELTSAPHGKFILFQGEQGEARVECHFESDSLWLTQNGIAKLYQKIVPIINEHLDNIYTDGKLVQNLIIREFRIVQQEVAREVAHYNL